MSHPKNAFNNLAEYWIEVGNVQNVSVKEYEYEDLGNSGRFGKLILNGKLHVKPKGATWDAVFPFRFPTDMAEEPTSGTLVFSVQSEDPLARLVNMAVMEYNVENQIVKALGKVPLVYREAALHSRVLSFAASLPKGDTTRRKLLAALREARSYQEYADEKKSKGEKPLSKEEWERYQPGAGGEGGGEHDEGERETLTPEEQQREEQDQESDRKLYDSRKKELTRSLVQHARSVAQQEEKLKGIEADPSKAEETRYEWVDYGEPLRPITVDVKAETERALSYSKKMLGQIKSLLSDHGSEEEYLAKRKKERSEERARTKADPKGHAQRETERINLMYYGDPEGHWGVRASKADPDAKGSENRAKKPSEDTVAFWVTEFKALDKSLPDYDPDKTEQWVLLMKKYVGAGLPHTDAIVPGRWYNEYKGGHLDLGQAASQLATELPGSEKKVKPSGKGKGKDKTDKEAHLRHQVIRLAAALPKGDTTRQKLLAVLREARGDWKPLVANDKVRVQWQDHPENTLQVQELPTKPLKRRLRRLTVSTGMWVHHLGSGAGDYFLMTNLLHHAKITSSMKFDQVKAAIREAAEKAKARVLSNPSYKFTEQWFKSMGWGGGWWFEEDEVYFLDVEPADYKPVSFAGRDFNGTAEWTSFKFYADRDEDEYMSQMEGMSAFYQSKSSGGARKLFKLLKADPDSVKNMNLDRFKALLNQSKIAYDYVPTVWR